MPAPGTSYLKLQRKLNHKIKTNKSDYLKFNRLIDNLSIDKKTSDCNIYLKLLQVFGN